ncbi:UTP--glucose-1-phosphate uridylyltransferase, partial [Pseudoalteromonas sp. S1727]
GGEIQLTDAIDMLMKIETVEAFHMSGRAHDCGDKLGYLKAIVEYSMRDENLGTDFTSFVTELVNPKKASHLKAV